MTPYLICATPRTGTNLLCEALAKTEHAGRPDEYFGHMHVPRWTEIWKTEGIAEYLSHLKKYTRSENGIWGIKVMMQYFDEIYELLSEITQDKNVNRYEILEETLGELKYVWVTREDKVAQAVSLHKAYQNFVWSVERGEDFPDEYELAFDFQEIDRIYSEILKNECEWKAYFQTVERQPHIVKYEDLIGNYETVVNGVLKHLGVSFYFNEKLEESRLQKQANVLSESWKKRYLKQKKQANQSDSKAPRLRLAVCKVGMKLNLQIEPDVYGIYRLQKDSSLPEEVLFDRLVSITRSDKELTVVCREQEIKEADASDLGWKAIRIDSAFELTATGVIAAISQPIADLGVSLYVVSTFDTDYILIKEENLQMALDHLSSLGHQINQ